MSSNKQTEFRISEQHQTALLQLAAASIAHGLRHGEPVAVNLADYPLELRVPRATFVTLKIGNQLRGCIGTLVAQRPLVLDVAENAFAAAFRDPRFPPLQSFEFDRLNIHISVLSPPEPVEFSSEADLLQKIRPGIDGLILRYGARQGTFLPAVWEDVPEPAEFLRHLKLKAGLPADFWAPGIEVQRYTTHSFGAAVSDLLSPARSQPR